MDITLPIEKQIIDDIRNGLYRDLNIPWGEEQQLFKCIDKYGVEKVIRNGRECCRIHFRSSDESWRHLAGREGDFYLYPDTYQSEFVLTIMS